MSVTDTIKVGDALPRIAEVTALDNWTIEVLWAGGHAIPKVIDLAPAVFGYKAYRPLRDDSALFKTVHPLERGAAIAWGEDDRLDMASTTVAHLAEEMMEPADFAEFLRRHSLTYDAAAAQLGVSRRLIAYYASERHIPRHIALACAYLDTLAGHRPEMPETARLFRRFRAQPKRLLLQEVFQRASHLEDRGHFRWLGQSSLSPEKPNLEPELLFEEEQQEHSPYRVARRH